MEVRAGAEVVKVVEMEETEAVAMEVEKEAVVKAVAV